MPENSKQNSKKRLAELIEPLAKNNGYTQSSLKEVRFLRSTISSQRAPVSYEPCIIIVAQGTKIGYLGESVYRYDPYNYLVLSVPLPFECETVATPDEPLLGMAIGVDVNLLNELLIDIGEITLKQEKIPRGIYSTPLTDELISASFRLLTSLGNPPDDRILGSQIVREIVYRVLIGEQGGALQALAVRHSRFGQIAKILKKMHTEFQEKFDMESLANEANMSISSFHNNFKAVTASSPLQYLKSIRLHKARIMMVQDGLNVGTAASMVGYESVSQFSREFKRFFGATPANEADRMRVMLNSH